MNDNRKIIHFKNCLKSASLIQSVDALVHDQTLEVLKSAVVGVNTVTMFCDHTAPFSFLMKCVTQPGHVYLPPD